MKKALITICIAIGVVFVLLALCRFSGALNFYTVSTPSNEPTLKPKSLFFASRFKKPDRFNFITYRHHNAAGKADLYVHRVCGLPGDKVQIINGDLWVNGVKEDTLFETYHFYIVNKSDFDALPEKPKLQEDEVEQLSAETMMLPLTKKQIAKYKIPVKTIWEFPNPYQHLANIYPHEWTPNNFGPLEIADASYFVLGDNRDNAQDSRYTGLINEKDFVGTMIWH